MCAVGGWGGGGDERDARLSADYFNTMCYVRAKLDFYKVS